MIRPALHIAALTVFGFGTTVSQSVTFSANVESNAVSVGQQFQVSFTLKSSQSVQPDKFQPPDFNGLVVLSGPMQSSGFEWINGRSSSSLSYVYVLAARAKGRVTIGLAKLEAGGKTYESDPLILDVAAVGAQGTKTQTAGQNTGAQEIGDNLYIRATTDKRRVRQGEQFVVTYKLYTRVSIENYFVSKAPTYEGFWAEDFDQSKSSSVATEMVDGKQYRVAVIKRTALFATQSGTLKITPLEVRCAVQLQTRRNGSDPFDIFNDPIFPNRFRTQELDFASNPVSITVDALPENPPAGFTGAAGAFTFDATIDKRDLKTGDPVTLKLVVSGTGNVKLVSIPKPSFPADLETYDPKVSEEIARDGSIIRGRKVAEYLVVPRNAGERTIEPVSFVYFDFGKNRYETLKSPRFVLNITPGKDLAAGGSTFASKEDVRLLGEDIRFLKLSPGELRRAGESEGGTGWLVLTFGLPPLVFFGAFVIRKRREQLLGNVSAARSQKAGREASKRLKTAEKLLRGGNTEQYHAEISRALFGYLGDKLSMSLASLTLETVIGQLQSLGTEDAAIRELRECVERAEFARFAPGADSQEARKDLLDFAKIVIGNLEKALNR